MTEDGSDGLERRFWRKLWKGVKDQLPSVIARNLTVKLLVLLVLGMAISGAVFVVSFGAIQDQITYQADAQIESETSLQAAIYENWLNERWTTLTRIAASEEIHHDSVTVVHQWLTAEATNIPDDIQALHVADQRTGEIIGSTDTRYHDRNLYDMGLNETIAQDLLFISRKPIGPGENQSNITLIGTRSDDRLLVAAVPTDTVVIRSQAFDSAETSLYSLSGHRLVGDASRESIEVPAKDSKPVVIQGDNTVYGKQVIAHDLLNAKPVREYDQETTVGTLVVTSTARSEVYAIRNEISKDIIISFIITFVLLIGTAAAGMRSVTVSVNRLSERARRISEGTFDVDVSSERNDEIGTLYASVGEMRDSLRQRIEQAEQREKILKEREEKYRNLFEETNDALMLLDRDGFFDCNEQTLELFGAASVEEMTEYTPWELSPPTQPDGTPSKEAALAHVEEAFETGREFFEWRHERVDGTAFQAEVKLSRFSYEGQPALQAVVRDITDRKEYEKRLERQRDNLEVLNQMVRHDIRNDLQMIIAYTELLTRDDLVEEAGEDHVETVLENAHSAVDLTKTAKDLADVMLQPDRELETVDIATVIESEVESIQSRTDDAVVSTEGVTSGTHVRADEMLDSVFRNLLKNAIDHNDEPVPEVTVTTVESDGRVQVRVADNGPGIPEGLKDTIFGKGEKGLESGGTGIGLYLVNTLVDRYGGDVWVEDNDPKGAIFVVELPTGGS